MDAIIDPQTKRSTGVVVGITGPWGSGKSSVLNLLGQKIAATYRNAVIFRFDPWLVRGRDELLTLFFRDLVSVLERRGAGSSKWRSLARSMSNYADALSAIAKDASATAGSGFSLFGWLLKLASEEDQTLEALRERLSIRLQSIRAPIVILIDELDRIDDEEVRVVAQLVRAILDLPQISYVIAYDNDRVIEALGYSNGLSLTETKDRGRAYLEKIVQHAISLPISQTSSLRRIFDAEMTRIVDGGAELDLFDRTSNYEEIANTLFDGIIETPRDIKRITGQFRILESMTRGEVDASDVLGYSALSAKRPDVVEAIKADPDSFVEDPDLNHRRAARFFTREAGTHPIAGGLSEPIQRLLFLLFPKTSASRVSGRDYGQPISKRRPLLTLLQLGLLPDDLPRSEVEDLISSERRTVFVTLQNLLLKGELGTWINRLSEIIPTTDAVDTLDFWLGASDFFQNQSQKPAMVFVFVRNNVDSFTAMMRTRVKIKKSDQRIVENILENLLADGDVNIAPDVLRIHVFSYGLFKRPHTGRREGFISEATAERLILKYSPHWKRQLLKGNLLRRLSSLDAIMLMIDSGFWDEEAKDGLWRRMVRTWAIFDRIILILFGGNHLVETDFLDRLVGADRVRERARKRMEMLGLPPNNVRGIEQLDTFDGDVMLAAALLRTIRGISA